MKITRAWVVGARPKLLLYHILLDLSIGKMNKKMKGLFPLIFLVNYFVVFRFMLFHGFVTNHQSFVVSIPEVFAE